MIEFRLKRRELELVTRAIGLPCGFQKEILFSGLTVPAKCSPITCV